MRGEIVIHPSQIEEIARRVVENRGVDTDGYTEKDIRLAVHAALILAVGAVTDDFIAWFFGPHAEWICEFRHHCDMPGCELPVRVKDGEYDLFCERHGAEEDARPVVVQAFDDNCPF